MHECMLSNIVSPIYPENWRAFAIFRTLRQYLYSFDMCYTVCTNVGHHTVQEVWKFMWPVVNYKEQEELKFKYSASLWRALFHRRLHAHPQERVMDIRWFGLCKVSQIKFRELLFGLNLRCMKIRASLLYTQQGNKNCVKAHSSQLTWLLVVCTWIQ